MQDMKGSSKEGARAAKAKALALLAGVTALNGVGICRVGNGYGVKINLSQTLSRVDRLPKEVDGVPLVVEIVGRIVKQPLAKRTS